MARKLKSDKVLFLATLLLVLASVVMVYSASAAMALTLASLETSTCTALAPTSFAIASAASPLMSAIITRAPSATNFRTIPAPNPEAPPVTIARLP